MGTFIKKRAFFWKALSVFSALVFILSLALQSSVVNFMSPEAKAVTSAVLSDPDTTGFGIDGRDFRVTWTPAATATPGFTRNLIAILPTAAADLLTTGNFLTTGCNNSSCDLPNDRGFFPFEGAGDASFTHNVPQFFSTDSAGAAWTVQAYKACIFTDATTDALTCTAANTPGSDSPTDTTQPVANHISVHTSVTGQDAVFSVLLDDDQTTTAEFAAGTGGSGLSIKHGTDVSDSRTTVACAQLSDKLFTCTLAQAVIDGIGNGSSYEYYLVATDKSANVKYVCQSPSAADETACQATPFIANVVTVGSITIAGTVSSGGAGLGAAIMFAGGFSIAPVTANGGGVYSFPTAGGLPTNTFADVTAFRTGYCDNTRPENIASVNLTGVDININAGECSFIDSAAGGGGGGGGKPHVKFSQPPEFDNFFPPKGFDGSNVILKVGFDQALNESTVNDTDTTNANSAITLLKGDGTGAANNVGGSVTYCASSTSSGCTNFGLQAEDTNTIVFSLTEDDDGGVDGINLATQTTYNLIMDSTVTSSTGQSIEGNRSGGGHKITFTTSGTAFTTGDVSGNFGTGGGFMPPYVTSVIPAPGSLIKPKADSTIKLVVKFNTAMDSTTLTANGNVKLYSLSGASLNAVTLGASALSLSADKKTASITTPALTPGPHELHLLGAAASAAGMPLSTNASQSTFVSFFDVDSTTDSTAPTIQPFIPNNSPISTNTSIVFAMNEQPDPSTITSTNVTLKRGTTSTSATVKYNPGTNEVSIVPNSALAPNTAYTVTFGTGVTDLVGNALGTASSFTYTTGAADTTAPSVIDAQCDDFTCAITFNEGMKNDSEVDGATAFGASVLRAANVSITQTGTNSGASIIGVGATETYTWLPEENKLIIDGLNLSNVSGNPAVITFSNLKDLSGNVIGGTNSFTTGVDDSTQTAGAFFNDSMFPPPTLFGSEGGGSGNGQAAGSAFKPEGFGDFTGEQFAFGQATMAFPFDATAGGDSGVFHVEFTGVAIANDYQLVLTFPRGTDVTNAIPDNFSPSNTDMNEVFGAGTVAFDNAFGADGVTVDVPNRKVTVQFAVSAGTPLATDFYIVDLAGIVNPTVAKGQNTGGYTASLKFKDAAGAVVESQTSMPYFIQAAGTNTINITVVTSTLDAADDGTLFMFGGGPGGPKDGQITLTNGVVSAFKGTADTNPIALSNLSDGCYFFGFDPYITLGANDFLGPIGNEPVCVSSSSTANRTFTFTQQTTAGEAAIDLTVILPAVNHLGADVDIFAGGPGGFAMKALSSLNTPAGGGYTLKLNRNGSWFVGFGPAMPKGVAAAAATKAGQDSLPYIQPQPHEIQVTGIGAGGAAPAIADRKTNAGGGSSLTGTTLTFTAATADKTVSGTVTDGTSGIANVEVFMHSQGFGAPIPTTSSSTGVFSLSLSDFGVYEIGAFSDGLPPSFNSIDVRANTGAVDGNATADVYYKGKLITVANPLVLKLKKASYYISGKVLDGSGQAVANATVFASDTNGNFVSAQGGSDGSYTLFVDNGTWTVKAELPPSASDNCGTFSKSVTVSGANKTSQNISPTSGDTCYTLSGTVSIDGSAHVGPLFVEEWDTANDRPVAGGEFKPASTTSTGTYSVEVQGSKTYKVATFDPIKGEIGETFTVGAANKADGNMTVAAYDTMTIDFPATNVSASDVGVVTAKSTSTDKKIVETFKGTDADLSIELPPGENFNVKVKLQGQEPIEFNSVASDSTNTVSLATANRSISGNVNDDAGTDLPKALVKAENTATGQITTAVSDSSGNYSLRVKEGTYEISTALTGHVFDSSSTSNLAVSGGDVTNYDFLTGQDAPPLQVAGQVITGTVNDSSGSPVEEGFAWAEDSLGNVVATAPIESTDGTYSLPVVNGTYTVKTRVSGFADATVANGVSVSGADATGNNANLIADSTRIAKSDSKVLSASDGGKSDDTDNSGIAATFPGKALGTSGDVTVNTELTYSVPDTKDLLSVGGAGFNVTASGTAGNLKSLSGNANLDIDYTSLVSDIPNGIEESELQLAYYSSETGDFVPVEGGYTIDATNNKITGVTPHLTTFAVVYPPSQVVAIAGGSGCGGSRANTPACQRSRTLSIDDDQIALEAAGTDDAVVFDDKVATDEEEVMLSDTTEPPLDAPIRMTEAESQSAYILFDQIEISASTLRKVDREFSNPEIVASNGWAEPYVVQVLEAGIAKGYSDGLFHPERNSNRAEFVKMVIDALGYTLKSPVSNPFTDVSRDAWYADYVFTAKVNKIVGGYPDGSFQPGKLVNRAEAVKILLSAAGFELPNSAGLANGTYPDVPRAAWFAKYVGFAIQNNIIGGYKNGNFGPDDPITRGQIAKVIVNILATALQSEDVSMLERVSGWFDVFQ